VGRRQHSTALCGVNLNLFDKITHKIENMYHAHLYEHLLADSNIRCRKQLIEHVKTRWLIMGDYFLFPQEHRDTDPLAEGQSGYRDPCHAQRLPKGWARNWFRRYNLDRQPLYLLHTCFGE